MIAFYRKIFLDGLWRQNSGLVVLLGLCPLLAVSNTMANGLGLGLATTLVLVFSNLAVSLARGILRPEIRLPAYVLIIASVVSAIQLLMHAWLFELYRALGIFIPLIVTNCAIIGRAESFASRNAPLASMVDGLATGLGFCLVLVLLGAVREFAGQGLLLAILPPGAFIALGFLIAGRNWLNSRIPRPRPAQAGAGPPSPGLKNKT